jgi:ATP-dependent DNA helicase recG-like protein
MEDLYKPHSSELRNKGIAEIFYDMELIEQWGSGIDKIRGGSLFLRSIRVSGLFLERIFTLKNISAV